jgi:hypothetical protein
LILILPPGIVCPCFSPNLGPLAPDLFFEYHVIISRGSQGGKSSWKWELTNGREKDSMKKVMEFALKPPERLITPVIRIFSWQEL